MAELVKLDLRSQDISLENRDKLKRLFPAVFKDNTIDFEYLKMMLGEVVEPGRERYGLSWAGKSEAISNLQTPSVGTLLPIPEESVNFTSTENLIIEGDNLEVLKLLQKSYHNKVKMIYIDPPYNTGNEFIYPDNFQEGLNDYLKYSGQISQEGIKLSTNTETDGRFHSKWLNMMYPRLFLARNLLREDGVIFVSIDDNEVHNLRSLMNEIFGEESFVGCFVWRRRASSALADKRVSTDHEYVLAYQRSGFVAEGIIKDFSGYSNPDNDPRGDWVFGDLTVGMTKDQRPHQYYDLVDPLTGKIYPANPNRVWAYIPESMNKLIRENRVIFPESETKRPMLKRFKNELKSTVNPISTWLNDVGLNSEATKEINDLFGTNVFLYSKPISLMKKLISSSTGKDDIILDFFSGSGTTAHAVLDSNAQDGGNRKFILIQLPEPTNQIEFPTIADITKERVRRVISKLKEAQQNTLDFQQHQKDYGFRVFKLSNSSFKIWDGQTAATDAESLAEQLRMFADNIRTGRTVRDMLYEILLKSGFLLTATITRLSVGHQEAYSVNDGSLVVCLEDEIQPLTLRAIVDLKPEQVVCLDSAFHGNDQLKTNTVLQSKSHNIVFHTV